MATDLYEVYSDYPKVYTEIKKGLENGKSIYTLTNNYIKPSGLDLELALKLFIDWCINELDNPSEDIVAVNVMATWLIVIAYGNRHDPSITPSVRLAIAVAEVDGILSLTLDSTPVDLMTAAIKQVLEIIKKDTK